MLLPPSLPNPDYGPVAGYDVSWDDKFGSWYGRERVVWPSLKVNELLMLDVVSKWSSRSVGFFFRTRTP